MPITILDHGSDNHVNIDADVITQSSGVITFNGNGNQVTIDAGCVLEAASITLGTNCTLHAGRNCRLAAVLMIATDDGHVMIGADTNFTWLTRLLLHEPGRITIGKNCLIASDTIFTVSDMHSIIDRTTGRRINPPADIEIGDRVWVAHNVTVLKGCRIGTGSVVGTGSLVTSELPAYALAVGSPARVIRNDVTWDKALLPIPT